MALSRPSLSTASFRPVIALGLLCLALMPCGPVYAQLFDETPETVYMELPLKTPGVFEFAIPDNAGPLDMFILENRTTDTIHGIHAFTRFDPSSAAAIARHASGDAANERDRAERIWAFLMQNVATGDLPTTQPWTRNPAALLSIAGCAPAGPQAQALAALWRAAGITSRVWNLGGYFVPEAQCGGAWGVFDPVHGVIYKTPDGSPASREYLAAHPDSIRSIPHPRLANPAALAVLYAAPDNHRLEPESTESDYDQRFSLLPGEGFVRHRESEFGWLGKHLGAPRPSRLSNCFFSWGFRPPLSESAALLPRNFNNLVKGGVANTSLRIADASRPAMISYERVTPWPIVAADVTIFAQSMDEAVEIEVFYVDNRTDTGYRVGHIKGVFQGRKQVSVPSKYVQGRHAADIRLIVRAPNSRALMLDGFVIDVMCQCSPATFPDLAAPRGTVHAAYDSARLPLAGDGLLLRAIWDKKMPAGGAQTPVPIKMKRPAP